ncbi:MAG: glycosyl-4,4'-diaponeurosporenoate acyltransferase [Lachnospiraceae bacterium]|nr:glycosyl-4,4'-diaponeurosporenoate acyltransferase [Lachnospiraceae bacterium]
MKFIRCVIYLALTGFWGFLVGRILPKKWFKHDSTWFSSRAFELDGKFYDRFAIRKWKDHLPDMSKVFPRWMPSKSPKMGRQTAEDVKLNLQETCVAEVIHNVLAMLGFGCVRIWSGPGGVVMALLCLLGNVPFVMVQRYNRPRFAKLYDRLKRASE